MIETIKAGHLPPLENMNTNRDLLQENAQLRAELNMLKKSHCIRRIGECLKCGLYISHNWHELTTGDGKFPKSETISMGDN